MKLFTSWLVAAAVTVAAVGSHACWIWVIEEPTCPESLIK